MKRLVLAWNYFFFGNVDKILDAFAKVIAKLDKAVEFHEARAAEAVRTQQAAANAEQAARASAAKAATAKTNLQALLGE
jgi:hypothetical protein